MKIKSPNILYLIGSIGDESVALVREFLGQRNTRDPNIYIYLSSFGGCLHSALTIYRLFRREKEKNNVHITLIGLRFICSAAVIVFLAGDKRYAEPRSLFTFHEVFIDGAEFKPNARYSTEFLKKLVKENERYDRLQAYLLARATRGQISRAGASYLLKKHVKLDADTARSLGIIDYAIKRKKC